MTDSHLLQLSEDDLCVEIGKVVASGRESLRPPTRDELRKMGSQWIERNAGRLRSAVCGDSRIKDLLSTNDEHLLFDITCEIVVHLTLGVPAGSVAAYLVKRGLRNVCLEA